MKRPERKIALLPATLRARLTVTIVLASVLIFMLVYGVTTVATTGQAQILAQRDAAERFDAIQQRLDLEGEQLDTFLVAYTEWQEFYDRTLKPDAAFISAEVDPWLAETSGATLVVWMDGNGKTVYLSGSLVDAAAVSKLAGAETDGILSGPVRLPSGPYVLAVRPIVGDPAHRPAGYLAVAKPITPELLASADPDGTTRITITGVTPADAETWATLTIQGGFSAGHVKLADRMVNAFAVLGGIDGNPVATIGFARNNAWYESSSDTARYAIPLLLGLLSLLLGLAVGMLLGRLMRRPIEDFVVYMREQGELAIEGLPYQETLDVDPELPDEFLELASVIEELLHQLRERQAELKRANEQAVSAEQAFRTVVNDSAEVKLLVRSGVVDIANPAAAACLGKPIEEVLRQPVSELMAPLNMTSETGELLTPETLFDAALDRQALVRCDAPDHGERWMKVSVSESAAPNTFLLTARNVTEEHRLEALRTEIVSLVSHDLRAPLTVISGYLELLSRPLDEASRAKAYEAASTAAGRMSSLLGELLETTRAEQVFAPSVFKKVRLGLLADEVAESMRLGTSREIVIVKRQDAVVLGDELRLRQAIENLIGNALKHTPEGTDVTVIVDTVGQTGVLAVEDHGSGIPDDEREAVFERFTQLRRNAGRNGYGLGLYIVRVIAESHAGSVRVEAAESGGARFVMEIPLAPRARRVGGESTQERDEDPSA